MNDVSWGTRFVSWSAAVEMMRRVKRFHKEGFYLLVDEQKKDYKVTLMGSSLTIRSKIVQELDDLTKQKIEIDVQIDALFSKLHRLNNPSPR